MATPASHTGQLCNQANPVPQVQQNQAVRMETDDSVSVAAQVEVSCPHLPTSPTPLEKLVPAQASALAITPVPVEAEVARDVQGTVHDVETSHWEPTKLQIHWVLYL